MRIKEKYAAIIRYFEAQNPNPETELIYHNSYELAVAVILSAQCTDKRVNLITPAFFSKFPDPESLADASVEDIFAIIRSCSYPNNKAKNLSGMAKMLVNTYKSKLPSDTDELQKLPGIGRKTAHVLASVLYNKPTLAVDTHVFRVSARIGLTQHAKNPLQCEQQIVKHLAPKKVHAFHHWIILHGRYTCTARNPKCSKCGIQNYCTYYQSQNKE